MDYVLLKDCQICATDYSTFGKTHKGILINRTDANYSHQGVNLGMLPVWTMIPNAHPNHSSPFGVTKYTVSDRRVYLINTGLEDSLDTKETKVKKKDRELIDVLGRK